MPVGVWILVAIIIFGAAVLVLMWDSDADGTADIFDNCPNVENKDQRDSNKNGIGDVCEDRPTTPEG